MHAIANILVALLVVCIYEEILKTCVCVVIGAQNNISSDYNGSDESSLTDDYEADHTSDILATTPDFVRKYGYPVETHTVTTEDGYLLTVHRIPGSPRAASSGVKTPVLVQHGLFSSSDSWVLMGPDKSLGFLLADQGYDVWLGNARGNFYSRKHVTLSPKDPKFWNFSWHEMGVYDLPAVIDHILATTDQKQLFYVGHSMGCAMFYVLTSMRPEYNQKIRLGVTMAPAVFYDSTRSPLIRLATRNMNLIYRTAKATGTYELAPRITRLQRVLGRVCRDGNALFEFCKTFHSILLGFNPLTFYTENAPVLFSHLLSGTSMNTFLHLNQNNAADRFQVFDPTVTMGKITPEYNLSRVTAPVYLLYAENDVLVHPDAVMRLNRSLPNVVRLHRLPDDLAGHSDFVFAKNGKQLVYDEMINQMNRYK